MTLALITGASSGIGMATAKLFAQNKIDLIICGRRLNKLMELKNILSHAVNVDILNFDVSNLDEVTQSLNSLGEKRKSIDILINNAGAAFGLSPFDQALMADMNLMIDTNLKGLIYVSRLLIPFMVERKKGTIINVSSIAGKETYPNGNVYCATKHAVDALTKGMRVDLNPHGIKVASVNPGMVETEFSLIRFNGDQEKAKQVYGGMQPLKAEDVADAIYFMASRPAHVVIADLTIFPLAQASSQIVDRK